jgi:hypothetical protein
MDSTADPIFQIVPEADMPPGHTVLHLDVDGQPRWLIREGTPLPEIVAELNQLATHIVRHGLWRPQRDDKQPPHMRHAS